MKIWAGIAWVILAVVLSGCGRVVLEGRVVDQQGEGLPGVAVMLSGTDYQGLTDARGDYRFVCAPGTYDARYAKSGYSQGVAVADTTEGRWNILDPVALWNLPSKDGVYIYEDGRYRGAGWLLPKKYLMADGTTDFGTQRVPEVWTDEDLPHLLFYKMPRYDVRLSRLQESTAKLPSDDSQTFSVWTAAGTLTTDLSPVVDSDVSLLQLEVLEPLQPGFYAVHWGALDGYSVIEERMYVFEVREPEPIVFDEVEPRMELTPTQAEREESRAKEDDAP